MAFFSHKSALILSSLLLSQVLFAAEDTVTTEESPEPVRGTFGLGWLDQTQAYASVSANGIATQMDRFFGEASSDQEAAYSSLRLTLEQSWYRLDGMETGVKLRGKVHLPRIEQRLSLIFSDDDGDGSSYYAGAEADGSRLRETRPSLEFNLQDIEGSRLDFRLGLHSSLKAKLSARYRYETALSDNFSHLFAQTLSFSDGIGFGTISRYQANYLLDVDTLVRWNNEVRLSEAYSGTRWQSQVNYSYRKSQQTALLYYTRVRGESQPSFISSYDIGFRIRRNIARPWLFVEVEPGHAWQKLSPIDERRSNLFLYLRLEMAIGRL